MTHNGSCNIEYITAFRLTKMELTFELITVCQTPWFMEISNGNMDPPILVLRPKVVGVFETGWRDLGSHVISWYLRKHFKSIIATLPRQVMGCPGSVTKDFSGLVCCFCCCCSSCCCCRRRHLKAMHWAKRAYVICQRSLYKVLNKKV